MSDLYASAKRRDRRGVWLAIGGLVTLLGGLYLAGWALVGGSVPEGTRVADVDIGGLSPKDAADRLESELADRLDQPIRLVWQGQRFQLDPRQAGLRLDVEATVREAGGGRSWNPMRMLETLFTTGDVPPVIDVDEDALGAVLDGIAKRVDLAPVEPQVRFDDTGVRVVSQPRSGHALDRRAVVEDIAAAYLRTDVPVQLRIKAVQPTAGAPEIAQALDTYVKPALSGPVRLHLPNRAVDLTVPEFASALTLRVNGGDGVLAPAFDVGRLNRGMAGLRERIDVEPRNARVVLRNGRPAVVPSRPGRRLAPARVANAVAPVLAKTGSARAVRVATTVWEAGFTTDDARRLGIRRVVSSSTTYYPPAHSRNVNLGRAAKLINGTVLRPGETFSFNETVGPRSPANGFTAGYVLKNGVVAKDVGGGVSQVAATAFDAAFFAGLEDVRHNSPTIYNDRFPAGRDAMVAWPSVDLRFRNTTPYGVLIEAWIVRSTPDRRGEMHVRMWSTKHWDITAGQSKRHHFRTPRKTYDRTRPCHARAGQPGFDVEVYRYFRRPGSDKLDHKETMRTGYLPADRVICRTPPRRMTHSVRAR